MQIKLKRQLRFWRARSWVTQHRALLATKPAKAVTKSQTEMDLRIMHTRKVPDTDIMVQARSVQEFLIPKLPLHLAELQNQTFTNPHLLSSRYTASYSFFNFQLKLSLMTPTLVQTTCTSSLSTSSIISNADVYPVCLS